MTPRVLITGATGFVGRQILAACVARNVNMRLVVRPGWQEKLGDVEKVMQMGMRSPESPRFLRHIINITAATPCERR